MTHRALQEVIAAMKAERINPAIIHAVQKTGRIVTVQNEHWLTAVEIAEWDAAIAEFEAPQPHRAGGVA